MKLPFRQKAPQTGSLPYRRLATCERPQIDNLRYGQNLQRHRKLPDSPRNDEI